MLGEVELIASPAPEIKKLCCGPAVLHQIQVLAVLLINRRISFQQCHELSLVDVLDQFRTNRSDFEERLLRDEELPHSCPRPLSFEAVVVQRGSPHLNGLQLAEVQDLGPDLVAMEDYLAFKQVSRFDYLGKLYDESWIVEVLVEKDIEEIKSHEKVLPIALSEFRQELGRQQIWKSQLHHLNVMLLGQLGPVDVAFHEAKQPIRRLLVVLPMQKTQSAQTKHKIVLVVEKIEEDFNYSFAEVSEGDLGGDRGQVVPEGSKGSLGRRGPVAAACAHLHDCKEGVLEPDFPSVAGVEVHVVKFGGGGEPQEAVLLVVASLVQVFEFDGDEPAGEEEGEVRDDEDHPEELDEYDDSMMSHQLVENLFVQLDEPHHLADEQQFGNSKVFPNNVHQQHPQRNHIQQQQPGQVVPHQLGMGRHHAATNNDSNPVADCQRINEQNEKQHPFEDVLTGEVEVSVFLGDGDDEDREEGFVEEHKDGEVVQQVPDQQEVRLQTNGLEVPVHKATIGIQHSFPGKP